jgi:DNA polymerase I-like protein with 3'-5' exonuclease and polymerase domains
VHSFPKLAQYPYFSYDTETTGLQYPVDRVFGVAISTPDGNDYYWDIRRSPKVVVWLCNELSGYAGRIICHGAKFDYMMSHVSGIRMPIRSMDCTINRATLIDETLYEYDLDSLAYLYLDKRKDTNIYEELAAMFGGPATRKAQIGRISEAPVEVTAKYAKQDSRLCLDLWLWQETEIKNQGISKIIDFERAKIPAITRANMRGVRVDIDESEKTQEKLTPIIESKQAELNKLCGDNINVNSGPQLKSKVFVPYQKEDGEWYVDNFRIGKTPKGGPSLGAEYLREMDDPRAKLIIEIRSLIKTRDTFLGKHILGHAIDGRVYPTINQNRGPDGGTGTGRLSYVDPALQQIPSRNKEVARLVKSCFLPEPGHVWVDADESSFEVRVFAHLVNNPNLISAYLANPEMDLHQYVADLMGIVRNATYSGQANAKQLNLSMIFNSGRGAIAQKIGLPWEWDYFEKNGKKVPYRKPGPEAVDIIDKYHARLNWSVKKLADKAKKLAESRGYIQTMFGRRFRFVNGYKAYKASGIAIQMTAGDINKLNWELLDDYFGEDYENDGCLILNTHDSYGMSLPIGQVTQKARDVKNTLESNNPLRVPLILEVNEPGNNWWESASAGRWM